MIRVYHKVLAEDLKKPPNINKTPIVMREVYISPDLYKELLPPDFVCIRISWRNSLIWWTETNPEPLENHKI